MGGGVPADECFIAGFVRLRKAIRLVLRQEEEENTPSPALSEVSATHDRDQKWGGG